MEQMRWHGGIADDVTERGHKVHRRQEKRTYGTRNFAWQQADQQANCLSRGKCYSSKGGLLKRNRE
jgi:hypothetical protein